MSVRLEGMPLARIASENPTRDLRFLQVQLRCQATESARRVGDPSQSNGRPRKAEPERQATQARPQPDREGEPNSRQHQVVDGAASSALLLVEVVVLDHREVHHRNFDERAEADER